MKPMLACTVDDLNTLKFPGYVSPKLDGIRALVLNGQVVSRKLLPIPNRHVQKLFGRPEYEGFDGELTLANSQKFNEVQSAVMTEDGEPDVIYQVFDCFTDRREEYSERLSEVSLIKKYRSHSRSLKVLGVEWVWTLEQLNFWHKTYVKAGFEGTIFRTADSPYKFGRSTPKEQYLVKIKDFKDDEAVITGTLPKFRNDNPADKDELGHTKRSSHKANKVQLETLGALVTNCNGHELSIGTGFTDAQRKELWKNRESLVGQQVKFKYQEVSEYGVPRFPTFLGLRDGRD